MSRLLKKRNCYGRHGYRVHFIAETEMGRYYLVRAPHRKYTIRVSPIEDDRVLTFISKVTTLKGRELKQTLTTEIEDSRACDAAAEAYKWIGNESRWPL